ncbi:hypothetical protein WH47_03588 [Habropoda laboriosa]|uniref:Uncharacterized protein n=1 Tax=Habropoda laboriosa TaxID=597456 RepID=A0A0L7RHV5_9HYME|nr:hypothetical protein WH47_03588 [Habropoda laboriosa]
MEEVRGSPARRLSQILDPIARLTTDFGSNSAPCSPRLGVRGHEPSAGHERTSPASETSVRRQQAGSDAGRAAAGLASGAESPRLWPRQFRQAPAPPPRPRHGGSGNANNNHSGGSTSASGSLQAPVHARDSPYVNVPNLLFQKDKGFAEAARSAGYVELRETKPKCSPYDFTSESSGHVEYTDKRTFAAQTDFDGSGCYEAKDLAAFARARSNFDPGPSPRGHFDRAYSFSGRQQEQQTGRIFAENRLYVEQRSREASILGIGLLPKKARFGHSPSFRAKPEASDVDTRYSGVRNTKCSFYLGSLVLYVPTIPQHRIVA